MAVDILFIAGVLLIAVAFWLAMKLVFGIGGSKGAMIFVLLGVSLLATQLAGLPVLAIPVLGLTLQLVYDRPNAVETFALGAFAFCVFTFISTQVV